MPTSSAKKTSDMEMLIAACDQIDKIDYKKLGEKLGCSQVAAHHRYTRFMAKMKGEKAGGSDVGEKPEGTKDGKREMDNNEADSSPKKKPRVKKPIEPAAAKFQVAAELEAHDDDEA